MYYHKLSFGRKDVSVAACFFETQTPNISTVEITAEGRIECLAVKTEKTIDNTGLYF